MLTDYLIGLIIPIKAISIGLFIYCICMVLYPLNTYFTKKLYITIAVISLIILVFIPNTQWFIKYIGE